MMHLNLRRAAAATGLALVVGMGMAAPTAANADRDHDRAVRAVHHDLDVIDHDQRRLRDLIRRAAAQRDRRDWRGLERTGTQIDNARLDLRRDEDILHTDQRSTDHYRYRYR